MTFEGIFEEPIPYPFRGDRILWLTLSKLPYIDDFYHSILKVVIPLISQPDPQGYIEVEAFYGYSGMSSACISKKWWLEKGLPLLEERIKEYNYSFKNSL